MSLQVNTKPPIPWRLFWSEVIGPALLFLVGLSLVILMFGSGSPMVQLIPDVVLRRTITGFLFGSTGALIALSAVGKQSGAHLNPVVTMAFWLFRKIFSRGYNVYARATDRSCHRYFATALVEPHGRHRGLWCYTARQWLFVADLP